MIPANIIGYLIEHPELWPATGKAGRQFVEEHYNIKKLNMQLVKICEKLLEQN